MRLLIFYLAILGLLSSCSGLSRITVPREAERQLLYANQLYQQKQFSLATQENLKIIEKFPQSSWAEKALYNLGLIYTDPDNPAKNYPKALEYFTTICKNHPKSSLAQESKNWMATLVILQNYENQIYRLKKIVQERDKQIKEIEKKIEQYKKIDMELEERERMWKK